MTEAMLFLLGFTCITCVYEIAKTGRQGKTDKIRKAVERIGKGR